MIAALKTAIKTKAITASGISASNFFYVKAPDGKTGLYVVYSGLPFEKQWDSLAISFQIPVQFNLYGPVESTVQAAWIALSDVFDFASLSVTGYTFVSCLPGLPNLPTTKVNNVWQAVLGYNIEITKLRS